MNTSMRQPKSLRDAAPFAVRELGGRAVHDHLRVELGWVRVPDVLGDTAAFSGDAEAWAHALLMMPLHDPLAAALA